MKFRSAAGAPTPSERQMLPPVASADPSGSPASDPALLDAVDVARDLDVDPATGLSAATAALRLERDGPNELRSKPPVPL